MKNNRSIPAATVIPVLIYPDVREAVAWLSAAFGFAEQTLAKRTPSDYLLTADCCLHVAGCSHYEQNGYRQPGAPAAAVADQH